jgi:hypothetical protein
LKKALRCGDREQSDRPSQQDKLNPTMFKVNFSMTETAFGTIC